MTKQSFFFQNEARNIEKPDIDVRKTGYRDLYKSQNHLVQREEPVD